MRNVYLRLSYIVIFSAYVCSLSFAQLIPINAAGLGGIAPLITDDGNQVVSYNYIAAEDRYVSYVTWSDGRSRILPSEMGLPRAMTPTGDFILGSQNYTFLSASTLSRLPLPEGFYASSVSTDGSWVIGSREVWSGSKFVSRVFRASLTGEYFLLPTLDPSLTYSETADFVSRDGSTILGATHAAPTYNWIWKLNEQTLTTLPIRAGVLSNDGTTALGYQYSTSPTGRPQIDACKWSSSTGVTKLDPSRQFGDTIPHLTSSDGTFIVGFYTKFERSKQFIWTPATGMQDAATFLASMGIGDLNKYADINVHGISANDEWIVGFATGAEEINNTFFKARIKGTSLRIVSTSMKDWHTFRIQLELSREEGSKYTFKVLTRFNGQVQEWSQSDDGDSYIDLDLRSQVERFTENQDFEAYVTMTDTAGKETSASGSVDIPIPAIVITGILTDGAIVEEGTAGVEDYFSDTNRLSESRPRYESSGPYPTLFGLDKAHNGYDPDGLTLAQCADKLVSVIESVIRPSGWTPNNPPKTYASKVDIIGHSKGGLVAREFLQDHKSYSPSVRKLILACSPHTGAVDVYWLLTLDVRPWTLKVYKELAPTTDWFRALPWKPFGVFHGANTVLRRLNKTVIPPNIDVHIFYGAVASVPTNVTAPFSFGGWTQGDWVVTQWSATGWEVVNDSTGTSRVGTQIPAFQFVKNYHQVDFRHDGYLKNASKDLYEVLRAPNPAELP